MDNAKIIAVDFDGTLVENKWPEIGAPIPITVTNYIRLLASGGLGKSEKYLVDELQMMLSAMNVEAATVNCDCIEVLRGQQKEGL